MLVIAIFLFMAIERDVSIECAGVTVNSGDLVFGDVDGVLVIPEEIAPQIIEAALVKIKGEDKTREELARGMLLAEVFEKHGVL